MKRFALTSLLAAALLGSAARADTGQRCEYWVTTTTGWVCLTDRTWYVRELPRCPAGTIWRVTQGDREQLWECQQ